ncbi:YbhB/YbcL family Raf kinase inhibitor-like protein [Nocardia aurantiaca]|uniref:YbhB/YbcL family Raf kinase inhibitor-like protein n=1 Tax=Nocardia aurantiaca TaxID=2675850 RepID=A0A6I3L525_9NOCA|nr:YbhB/YbcL family Raf kinase inhibitor-like protein [Nocardia aurantiaca]MTE16060.1 YbhB/YbcL family Raf kinase inhibitor-like protein [Nocardia aurantiaca]
MKVRSDSFDDNARIPGEFAYGVPDAVHHVRAGANHNPHLAWDDVPAETRSFAVVCCDIDVPRTGSEANIEGLTIPQESPRADFYHLVLFDIPVGVRQIAAGSLRRGVTTHGKPGPTAPHNARYGLNDFSSEGIDHYGYDGPCPPWNDQRIHRYVFTVYALDAERLPLRQGVTGKQLRQAMIGHILGQAELVGTYTLNPGLNPS